MGSRPRPPQPADRDADRQCGDAGVWGRKYPAIAQSWRRNWEHVIPFFAFPVAVRRIIYTTNAIESLNAKLRRAVRTRGHFPTDEAAIKLLYLVLRQVADMENAAPRMVRGQDPIRYHLRRQVRQSMMRKTGPAHKISDTPTHAADEARKKIDDRPGSALHALSRRRGSPGL